MFPELLLRSIRYRRPWPCQLFFPEDQAGEISIRLDRFVFPQLAFFSLLPLFPAFFLVSRLFSPLQTFFLQQKLFALPPLSHLRPPLPLLSSIQLVSIAPEM